MHCAIKNTSAFLAGVAVIAPRLRRRTLHALVCREVGDGRRRADVPGKDIIDNAVNSKDHTTLVAAVKAAGLVETLRGTGRSPCSRRPTPRSGRCPPAPSTRC